MLDDGFKRQFKDIPFAVYEREKHPAGPGGRVFTLLHYHKEFEIIAVLGGTAEFTVNQKEFAVSEGDLVFIPPYFTHNARFECAGEFSHVCICFDLCLLHDNPLQTSLESGENTIAAVISKKEPSAAEIQNKVLAAAGAWKRQQKGWQMEVCGNLLLLFGQLLAEGKINGSQNYDREKDFSYKVIEFISRQYISPVTSKDAAAALFLNNSYFCRVFKASFGQTFGAYLCAYRIEKSKEALRDKAKSVSEAAELSGFQSVSYYIKMFKKAFGCSPGEYRKRFETFRE